LTWIFRFANCSFKSLFTAHSSDRDWWFLKFHAEHDIVAALHPSPFTKFKQAQLNQSIQAIFLGEYLLIFIWYQMHLKSWRYNCPWDNLSSMSLATILAAYWELVAMILLFYFFSASMNYQAPGY
jgi:hypothetical protein